MATFSMHLQRFEICAFQPDEDEQEPAGDPASTVYTGRLNDMTWLSTYYFETSNDDGFARVLASALVDQAQDGEFSSHEKFDEWALEHCVDHLYSMIARQIKSQMAIFDMSLHVPQSATIDTFHQMDNVPDSDE